MNVSTRMVPSPLADPVVIQGFLDRLFGHVEEPGLIEIAYSDEDGGAIRRAKLFENTPEGRQDAAQFAVTMNATKGVNVYFAPSLRKPNTHRSKRAGKADVLGSPMLWADFDDPGAIDAALEVYRVRAVPHEIVVTGRTPHTRVQAFWSLDELITDHAELDECLAGIQVALGFVGDAKVVNADRVMRLPGCVSWPKPGKEGRVPELTENPPPDRRPDRRYSAEELELHYPRRDPKLARKGMDAEPGGTGGLLSPRMSETTTGSGQPAISKQVITTLPKGPKSPRPETEADWQGRRTDGREDYAKSLIFGLLCQCAAELGRWPTPDELLEKIWPIYKSNVAPKRRHSGDHEQDLETEGRGRSWLTEKCETHVRRAQSGVIADIPTVVAAAALHAERNEGNATAPSIVVGSAIQTSSTRDLALRHFDMLCDPVLEDAWLIEDVIPEQGMGVIYGPPGCGKTFFVADLALAIAGGSEDWRGKYVVPGAVMYFGMEGGRLFQNRIAAYAREKGRAPYFHLSNVNLDLRSTPVDAAAIVAEAKRIEKLGTPVKLVVVDTLNRALHGGNENAPEDMGAFVAVCEAIRKEIGCYAVVVHHCGKDVAAGLRGHSSLLGAIDTSIELDGSTAQIAKQRDGIDGLRFGYRLRSVELGRSLRGKLITSCVVEEADAQGGRGAERRLSDGQARVLEGIRQFTADQGEPTPGGTGWPAPGKYRCVERDALKKYLIGREPDAEDRARAERRVRDALSKLDRKGFIACNHGKIWVCG